jgi:hypothetical protein
LNSRWWYYCDIRALPKYKNTEYAPVTDGTVRFGLGRSPEALYSIRMLNDRAYSNSRTLRIIRKTLAVIIFCWNATDGAKSDDLAGLPWGSGAFLNGKKHGTHVYMFLTTQEGQLTYGTGEGRTDYYLSSDRTMKEKKNTALNTVHVQLYVKIHCMIRKCCTRSSTDEWTMQSVTMTHRKRDMYIRACTFTIYIYLYSINFGRVLVRRAHQSLTTATALSRNGERAGKGTGVGGGEREIEIERHGQLIASKSSAKVCTVHWPPDVSRPRNTHLLRILLLMLCGTSDVRRNNINAARPLGITPTHAVLLLLPSFTRHINSIWSRFRG